MQILTNEYIQTVAPSVFAQAPWQNMSEKYRFIPTIDVVDKMRENGFMPVRAQQSITRIEGKGDFTKHMLRFRHQDFIGQNVGDEVPEIVLINSHDGTSAYKLLAGIFRLVCSNGMVVQSADFDSISVRHNGKQDMVGEVIDASYEIIENVPAIMEKISNFKNVNLSLEQQNAFAAAALELKGENPTIRPIDLLHSRRSADSSELNGARDLYKTMNVIQENMLRGGLRGRSASGRRSTTRAVKSVNEDVRINRALWRLTEEMSKIAA